MDLLPAVGAFFLLERPLPPMRVLRTMPLLMLINALPRHLFSAVTTISPGLQSRLGRSMSTFFATARVVMPVVQRMPTPLHFLISTIACAV